MKIQLNDLELTMLLRESGFISWKQKIKKIKRHKGNLLLDIDFENEEHEIDRK